MRVGSIITACCATAALAATPAEWRSRSTYQVMTDRFARTDGSTNATCNVVDRLYCGGSWQGIIDKLDYIQGMGFSAIWISPITQQIHAGDPDIGDPYHGYWQNNIEQINTQFGSSDDLHNLVDAVHARNMFIMLDVVVNHYAWNGSADEVQYDTYVPFNESYYFHPFCQITQSDYVDNQTAVEQCWLGDPSCELPDMDTENDHVISTWNSWIANTVQSWEFDGLRVDTVKHIRQSFWPAFNEAAGSYCMGEVADGNVTYVCAYQEVMDGLANYPLYYSMLHFLEDSTGNVTALQDSINALKYGCADSTLLAPFSENQDVPRFPSLVDADEARTRNAIVFSMLADGVPVIYQGQEQFYQGDGDPYNRGALWFSGYNTDSEWYQLIAKVNNLRNHAIAVGPSYLDYKAWPVYTDNNTIGVRKGYTGNQIVTLFSNLGTNGSSNGTVGWTDFDDGQTVVDVISCDQYTASSDGLVSFTMDGNPKALYGEQNLAGSGICGL